MRKIFTAIALALSLGLGAQDCYDPYGDKNLRVGYFYDQGNNLAAFGVEGFYLIGNLFKVGGLVNQCYDNFEFESEVLIKLRDMEMIEVADPDLKVNSNTFRASIFYGTKSYFDDDRFWLRPVLGFTVQEYAKETRIDPEIGLRGRIPFFRFSATGGFKILRVMILFDL